MRIATDKLEYRFDCC